MMSTALSDDVAVFFAVFETHAWVAVFDCKLVVATKGKLRIFDLIIALSAIKTTPIFNLTFSMYKNNTSDILSPGMLQLSK